MGFLKIVLGRVSSLQEMLTVAPAASPSLTLVPSEQLFVAFCSANCLRLTSPAALLEEAGQRGAHRGELLLCGSGVAGAGPGAVEDTTPYSCAKGQIPRSHAATATQPPSEYFSVCPPNQRDIPPPPPAWVIIHTGQNITPPTSYLQVWHQICKWYLNTLASPAVSCTKQLHF